MYILANNNKIHFLTNLRQIGLNYLNLINYYFEFTQLNQLNIAGKLPEQSPSNSV